MTNDKWFHYNEMHTVIKEYTKGRCLGNKYKDVKVGKRPF